MSDRLSSSRAGDQEDEAVSRDFCCFLCNGRQMLHGYISLHASFMSLCLFNRYTELNVVCESFVSMSFGLCVCMCLCIQSNTGGF